MLTEKQKWALVSSAAGALGAFVVRGGLEQAWKAATGEHPPKNPAARDVSWRDAIVWTVATGALIGLGRLVAERAVTSAWDNYKGRLPPM